MASRSQSQPRVVGTYGEFYTHEDGTTQARLTAEGRAKLAEWMVKHPHPVAFLQRAWPRLFDAAIGSGYTMDELDSACMEGMVKGFIRHQEGRNSSLVTSVGWAIRGTVADLMRRDEEYRKHESQVTDHWRRSVDVGSSEPEAKEGWKPDTAEYVALLIRRSNLSHRDRGILTRLLAEDRTLQEVAKAEGLSKERIRQIRDRSLRKIREANILEGVC